MLIRGLIGHEDRLKSSERLAHGTSIRLNVAKKVVALNS